MDGWMSEQSDEDSSFMTKQFTGMRSPAVASETQIPTSPTPHGLHLNFLIALLFNLLHLSPNLSCSGKSTLF